VAGPERGVSGRRLPILVVVGGLLVVLALVGDGGMAERPQEGFEAAAAPAMPVADDDAALSSTWYCAGGTAGEGLAADLVVVVANPLPEARRGTVTWYPGEEEPVPAPFQVDANDVVSLPARQAVTAPVVAAVVELEGGGAAVEQQVTGPEGHDAAPCATAPSRQWHFANGSTTRDARQALFLFNPFPDDAVVEISFATEQLREEPVGLQGLPVPPGTLAVVNVGAHVRRREVTATSVVARSGRLVVGRVQTFDGSDGRRGLSLGVGAPAPSGRWHFPDGLHADGLTQQWHLYNPGDDEAVVLVEVAPDEGPAPPPLERTVPGRSRVTIDAAEETPVPAGVGHATTVRALDGARVVAEREVDVRAPAAQRGWSSTLGSPVAAERWLLPVGDTSGTTEQRVVLYNPAGEAATASIAALVDGRVVDLEDLGSIELGPGRRQAFRLGGRIARSPLPVVVDADGPVVVERGLYRPGEGGVSLAMGVPRG
jgi:hypothetical protein